MQALQKIEIRKKSLSEKEIQEQKQKEDHDFYYIEKDHSGQYKSIKIHKISFLERLKKFGFYRYDLDNGSHKFIQVESNTIKEVSETYIVDTFLNFVSKLDPYLQTWDTIHGEHSKLIDPATIIEKIYNSLEIYFKKPLLQRLIPDKPIEIQEDTKECKYLFYQNGFLKVTADDFTFEDYNILDKYVWKDQILPREFITIDTTPGYYEKFIFNVCGQDRERFKSMQSIIGYNLHSFNRCKLHATVLTDSRISQDGEANGRSGKTLWGKGLSHMLNTNAKSSVFIEINGRDFDSRENVKYSAANLNTTLIHINDAKNRFNIENLFNDITEGIKVKKLYQDPFIIRPKLIISSNQTIIIEGDSAKDRVIQFEFSDYYNAARNPAQEFNHWFFDDWDSDQWNKFDSFNIRCIQLYLKHGLIKPAMINLGIRTLYDHTAREFVAFMDDIFSTGIDIPGMNNLFDQDRFKVEPNERYEKQDIFKAYTQLNPDFNNPKFKQRTFTRWVRMYCTHKSLPLEEARVNGKDFFIFK